jgi:hypothetical protein
MGQKGSLKGKFIAINAYVRTAEGSQMSTTLHLKEHKK